MTTPRSRDIYGRSATSNSRGKTHERILARRHDPATLPGADELLAKCPAGSIGAGMTRFHREWVAPLVAVTARRAYGRTLVFLAKDLAGRGAGAGKLTDPLTTMTRETLTGHLAWRSDNGLLDPAELQRSAAHMTRLATWLDANAGTTINLERGKLRALVSEMVTAPAER